MQVPPAPDKRCYLGNAKFVPRMRTQGVSCHQLLCNLASEASLDVSRNIELS